MLILLHIVSSCLHTTMADMSPFDKNHIADKAQDSLSLGYSRNSLPTIRIKYKQFQQAKVESALRAGQGILFQSLDH